MWRFYIKPTWKRQHEKNGTFYLLVVTGDGLYILDVAAKIDATADYICKAKWGDVEFPPPFGREAYPEVRSVYR